MPASASQDASVQPNSDDQDAQHDLEKLAAELGPRGFKTVLTARDGRLPCLDVLNPAAPVLTERIYAQADSFWWPWAQVIASRDHPAAAADAIARALRTGGPEPAGE